MDITFNIYRLKNKWCMRTGKGEWWMSYEDFLHYFSVVAVVHINRTWTEKSLMGSWSPRLNRSQYLLRIFSDTEVKMALSQCHRRQLRDELLTNATDLPIKIDLYQATYGQSGIKVDRRSGSLTDQMFARQRIRTFSSRLEKGTYIIVPSNKKKSSICEFQLRVALPLATDFDLKQIPV